MKKYKVLLTTGIFPPEIGGPATYSALLQEKISSFGVEVQVLPFRTVRHFPKIIRHAVFLIKVLILGRKVDLLYSQDPVSVGFPTMIASKILRKPFLVRIAGDHAWEQAVQRFGVKDSIDDFQKKKYGFIIELLKKIQTTTARNAHKVIDPSKYFCNLVSNWSPGNIHAVPIYNGIKIPDNFVKPEIKPKSIITAGRLVPWKGFDALIELMKELPDWSLEIAGDGPDMDTLQSIIDKANLSSRVKLLGSIDRELLLDKIARSEIFILNTAFESFSFQVVEAMYVETPVITTNIGNLPEIIDHNDQGVLVEPNDKVAILEYIHKIHTDVDFKNKIVKNAKEKSKNFSIESTMEKTAHLIIELCSKT